MNKFIPYRALGLLLVLLSTPAAVFAHCDTLEGPVVTAARDALAKRDVTPVLMWVKTGDEPAIREAFAQAVAVRQQSAQAAALADKWFFETLVRIHRAGEGAPYTGLKTESNVEPGIAAADQALTSGKVTDVLAASTAPLEKALTAKYERTRKLKAHAGHSVEAGREYVAAYVEYIHMAEHLAALAEKATSPAHSEHQH